MEQISTTIEHLKLATATFSKMFPAWNPRIEDSNLENMIEMLRCITCRSKEAQDLLEKLLVIKKVLSGNCYIAPNHSLH